MDSGASLLALSAYRLARSRLMISTPGWARNHSSVLSALRSGNSTGLEVIANHVGKRLDEDNPLLNAQLPDGSRIAGVIPPVVRPAPALTIRKFTSRRFTVD